MKGRGWETGQRTGNRAEDEGQGRECGTGQEQGTGWGTGKRKEDRDEDGGQGRGRGTEREREKGQKGIFLSEISPHPCKRGGDLYVRFSCT